MPILAAIPAVVGAGIAIADAVDGPQDDPNNLGQHSEESKSSFYSPMGKDNWGGMSGIHGDWQNVGKVGAPDAQGVYSARGQRYGSRAEEGKALGLIQQYATGKESAARREASNAVDQAQTSMASQAAAAGSSPAAQRAAMYGQAAMGQNIAGTTAAAAAKEQLGAQQAYLTGAGARRQQDIASQLAEQQWYGQQGAFALGANQQKQSALSLGMQQADTERNARMAYEKMLRGQSMDQQKLDEEKRSTNMGAMKDVGVGLLNAAATAASGGSDRSVKKGVSTPSPEDIFGASERPFRLTRTEVPTVPGMTWGSRVEDAARAGAGARFDPNWQDLYSEANQDVFAGPYNQDWDKEAVENMQTDRRRAALGKKQAAANAGQTPISRDEAARQNLAADESYQRVPLSHALNSLQGFSDKPVPGTWGNSTLNSIQQIFGSDEKVKQGIRGLSDEDLSHEVARRAGGDPVRALLDSVDAKKYRYKDPDSRGARTGEQIGVMAQDLEKTPAGAALVSKDGPGGTRMVDYGKSLPLIFAAAAQLNDRVNRLEGRGESSGREGRGSYANERTRPQQQGVAVMRGGRVQPGSDPATAAWLAGEQIPPGPPSLARARSEQIVPASFVRNVGSLQAEEAGLPQPPPGWSPLASGAQVSPYIYGAQVSPGLRQQMVLDEEDALDAQEPYINAASRGYLPPGMQVPGVAAGDTWGGGRR